MQQLHAARNTFGVSKFLSSSTAEGYGFHMDESRCNKCNKWKDLRIAKSELRSKIGNPKS